MKKSQPNGTEAGNDKFFQQLAVKYLPYWPLFLILIALFVSLAYFYIQYAPPVYESTASILIKDKNRGQEDSKMEELLNIFGEKKIVENELEVLRSNEVINQIVISMRLYAPVDRKSGWITRSGFLTSPVVPELADPKSIKETENIPFTYAQDQNNVKIENTVFPLDKWTKSDWGMLRFVKNPNYKVPAEVGAGKDDGKYSFSLYKLSNIVDAVTTSLKTVPTSKQSSVINISYKDEVPARGESVIMSVVNTYNNNAVQRKSEFATSTQKFIEDRLKNVKYDLDSIESSIQKYRNRTGIVDISEQSKLYLQNISQSDQQKNQMKTQLAAIDEVQKYLEAKNGSGSVVPSTFNITDPTLTQLITKLQTAQTEYTKLKQTTGENNPMVSSVQNEITKTKSEIQETIKSQRNNIQASMATVNETANSYSSMANSIPQKERELVEVSRQRNIKADIYAFLLQKREEAASYSVSSIQPDSYMVDNPTTGVNPVSPKKYLILLFAFIAPFGVGAAIISGRSALNNKVLFRSEIENMSDFPVIGEIIQGKFENSIVTASKERSFIVEQFRHLRSSLINITKPAGTIKQLVVTSSIEGEGKSFVAVNLANSIARTNKKVILLEMDLHQPSICEMMGIERGIGITDYLSGKVSVEEILLQTQINPDLYFVSAGNLDEQASELLLNGKLEILLNYLNTQADMLIIDMPPVNPISDLYVVAPLCDYVLYIIRHGKAPKNTLKVLDENMDSHNIKKVALVFNGIKRRGTGKYSYGYGYGYGYDYKSSYDSYGKNKKKKVG